MDARQTHDALVTGTVSVAAGVDPLRAPWQRKPPRLGRMDRLCGLALLAAEGALADAGIDAGTWDGDRVAVVLGTAFGCHATNEDYYRGVLEHGAASASPRLFAYTLPSSPLGEVTIHLGARGPAETIVSGRHAGVEALGRAAALVSSGRVDVALVVAVEVATPTLAALGLRCAEGAAAVLLESRAYVSRRGGRARAQLLAAASAFGGAPDRASTADTIRERMAAEACVDLGGLTDLAATWEPHDGAVSSTAAVVRWLNRGAPLVETGLFLVTDPHGGAAGLLARTCAPG